MTIPWTLLLYISRSFLRHLSVITIIISTICFLGAAVENFRRLANRGIHSADIVIKMSLTQIPSIIELTLPFVFLIAAMSCCFSLTRNNELNAARASGIPALIFIQPLLVIALISGVFVFSIYNPVSTALNAEHNEMNAVYFKDKPNFLSLSDSGIWLRQGDDNKNSVVHASRVGQEGVNFFDVTIFLYENQNRFIGRLDAKKAQLKAGEWNLDNVWITKTDGFSRFVENYKQPTSLTLEHVYDSVSPANTISFWSLGRFIDIAKSAGLSVSAYEFQWHSLVALPFFLLAMVLFGACAIFFFSVRQGREIWLIASSLSFGFIVYALVFLGGKMAISAEAPTIFLVWTPIVIAFGTGVFLFLQKEEG